MPATFPTNFLSTFEKGAMVTPEFIKYWASLPNKLLWSQDKDNQQKLAIKTIEVPNNLPEERWLSQVMSVAELGESEMEVDVAVIGSGAGGAAAAWELASQGLAVALLEEGDYYGRKDFNGDIPALIRKLYRYQGLNGSVGNTFIPLPIGKSVGGTTTINSGTCMRTPNKVLAQWQSEGLCNMTPSALLPYFDRIESALSVSQATPSAVGPIADIINTGAHKLGLVKTGALSRNAIGCDGQGLCQFGCPTGAKQSTNVSLIPQFCQKGGLVLKQARADQILWQGNQVTGLKVSDTNQPQQQLTLKCRHVVLAAGTLQTPQWLHRNGIRNRWLGKNLSIHPAGGMGAWFPGQNFKNTHTIPQGFGIKDLAHEGILFEGATPPLPGFALFSHLQGQAFEQQMAKYQETAFFGFMIKDSSRGRVPLSWPSPLHFYSMNAQDFKQFKRGLRTLGDVFFAAGAREIFIPGFKKQPVIQSRKALQNALDKTRHPRQFFISAYHPLGTARIANKPVNGVCDPNHRVFGTSGLYVMDGSAIPSALGANPQITIMALALRAAEKLAKQIQQAG